jgi:hypothetical protein
MTVDRIVARAKPAADPSRTSRPAELRDLGQLDFVEVRVCCPVGNRIEADVSTRADRFDIRSAPVTSRGAPIRGHQGNLSPMASNSIGGAGCGTKTTIRITVILCTIRLI